MVVEDADTEDGAGALATIPPIEWLAWSLVCAGVLLDVGTTAFGLSQGLVEANPIVREAMARLGPVGAMLALKGTVLAVGIVAWSASSSPYRHLIPLGMAFPWLLAGLQNVVLLVGVLY